MDHQLEGHMMLFEEVSRIKGANEKRWYYLNGAWDIKKSQKWGIKALLNTFSNAFLKIWQRKHVKQLVDYYLVSLNIPHLCNISESTDN